MTNRFPNPRPSFWSSTAPYSGGSLTFTASGTSTPLSTYSDPDLAAPHANNNPLTLNSAGRPDVDIWLTDAAYRVILKDSAGVVIWTCDNVYSSDFSATAQFYSIAGTPNAALAGTAGSAGVPADSAWDITNKVLYVCTTTGTASTAVWTAVNASSVTSAVSQPQGRLTLVTGLPVLGGDVVDAGSVYYTPYVGNLVPLYNGSAMIPTSFAELTLTLNATPHVANAIYDVFVFSNSGVVTLATGPAWTTATAGAGARGAGAGTSELSRIAGYWVNTVSATAKNGANSYTIAANRGTYVGSIVINGTGAAQITCHYFYGQSRKWGVWNAYNRSRIFLQAGDATATWTYASATIRASNNDSANKCTVFAGLAEEPYDCRFLQRMGVVANNQIGEANNIIGYNVTNALSGTEGDVQFTNASAVIDSVRANSLAQYRAPPSLGINNVQACERTPTFTATVTFYGTEASGMKLTAEWWG